MLPEFVFTYDQAEDGSALKLILNDNKLYFYNKNNNKNKELVFH